MFRLLFLPLLLFSAAASATLEVDGSFNYLYSSFEYDGASTFTLLSKAGTVSRLDLSLNGGHWDLLATGEIENLSYSAPSSKTVSFTNMQAASYGAGLRYRTPFVWLHASYDLKDVLYLETIATDTYNLKKVNAGFATVGFKMFGLGKGYQVSIDGDLSVPASTPTTTAGKLTYQYRARGLVHLEFGKKILVGVQTGVESHQYRVSTDNYYRAEFSAGVTLNFALGGSKSGGGGGGYDGPIPK